MKLDLNACWDEAMRLVGMNREVVLVLAGVFFFLPYAIFMTLIPFPDLSAFAGPAGETNSTALEAALRGFFMQFWWAILLLALAQTIGALAILAIIGDHTRPTVGAAVSRGLRRLPASVAAQIMVNLAILLAALLFAIVAGLSGSGSVAVTLLLFLVPLAIWMFTRLSLTNPAIAIEDQANPLAAIVRSWRLTRDNGLRLAVFYLLLITAFFVISQVVGLVISLAASLPGPEMGRVIEAVASGLLSSVMTLIIYAVMATVHRQLARAERTSALDPV